MGQPQGAAPHLLSNCRMNLLPQQVLSSMDLLGSSRRRRQEDKGGSSIINTMMKAFDQSSREADEKWMKFEGKRMKFEAENE